MIISIIFFAHFIFALFIFTKKWQEESISAGFLNLGFIIIIFAVGWTVVTMIINIFIEPQGFGIFFDRDTISLTLLSLLEVTFYKFYYKDEEVIAADTGK